MSDDAAPCKLLAASWRKCLKKEDYMPDRVDAECATQRTAYYECVGKWRRETNAEPSFGVQPQCVTQSELLKDCMMINMFEVSLCRKEMDALKSCSTEHDPNVAFALKGDTDPNTGEAEGVRHKGGFFGKVFGH